MIDTDRPIAVLGLGRMGQALALRLADLGASVTGWSRTPRTVPNVRSASTPGEAVRDAGLVVLALFDGAACAQVVAACAADLPSHVAVLNVSTVAPGEAAALERGLGEHDRAYLHCPVLGSVSAARTGALTLLAGGRPWPDIVEQLGEVIPCGDAVTAARVKLLANSVLADSVVALGRALSLGRRLGIDESLVLDVLDRTTLGGLASRKRPWLAGRAPEATFTAAALRKDLGLLRDADPLTGPLLDDVLAAGAGDDDDIAAISLRLGRSATVTVAADARLEALPTVPGDADLLAPLVAYARGHATGDDTHFRAAFRPSAHVEGIRDGTFVSWTLDGYCANFDGVPADDEHERRRIVVELRRTGSVAHATMHLRHGAQTFTDLFVMICEGGTWRIANKVYHRE